MAHLQAHTQAHSQTHLQACSPAAPDSETLLRIAISGASSGIGRALALRFASEASCIYIAGRNEARILETKAMLLERNPNLEVAHALFDVDDEAACKAWCESIFNHGESGLDMLILNAGMAVGTDESASNQIKVSRTNAMGVAHLAFYALELWRETRNRSKRDESAGNSANRREAKPQLVLISSIASLAPLPNAPSYSASKYFVRILGESLSLVDSDIDVSVICPGFIRTPLTEQIHPLIPQMSLEYASHRIYRAIKARKRKVIFPFWLGFLARFYAVMPFFLQKRLAKILEKSGKL